MPFVIGGGSGGGGSLSVRDEFVFNNVVARDDYFTLNPSKLQENINVVVNGELQKHSNGSFVDITPVIRGGKGTDAPQLIIEYSANGSTGWSATLNPALHKFWRWSVDGGVTWSPVPPATARFSASGDGNGVPAPYEYTIGPNNILELRKGTEVISTVDEHGFWSIESLSTGNGDLYLGEGHYVGSSGENVIFKNESSDLFWHPCWGAISADGSQIVEQSARVHFSPIQTTLPAGNQGVGQVDYNSTFTAVSNAAFLYLDIVPLETFSGQLRLTVTNAISGNRISAYDFDANYIYGGEVRVPFKRPIWAIGGQQYTAAITKLDGSFLQVKAGIGEAQPWRRASFLTFADYDVYHAGNVDKQALALTQLSGANRIAFSGIRDVPTMSGTVAGIAKLGATMSINGNGELNTAISPTSIPIVTDETARLAIPQSTGVILAIQQDNGITYGIEANNDPSVAGNWKQIGTVATSVVSFNGRSGAVTPATDDYNMEHIGLTDRATATKYVFRVEDGVPYIEEIA
jgi:hypothetical protein